ncbi:MAG: AMP-binding protein [Bacteroidales bacterium]|nr:MAG: AMP-binding protein [Bacteroidales bacterium]
MTFFLKDINKIVDWSALIEDINKENAYNPYCRSKDNYSIFKHIIISMLRRKDLILLDSDFSDSELETLTNRSDFEEFNIRLDKPESSIQNKSELIEKLKSTDDNWKITLFTSGTTGVPKKVTHNFKSITRFVKYSEQNKDDIWGFAYNPTHMAGLQVFFQALLNGNSIINIFQLTKEEIYKEIENNKITHISATPTFYRLLLPCSNSFPSVKRITSGGEKYNEKISFQLSDIFPHAKITNVYASTEAGTLFASENDVFSVKSEFKRLVKIENNELFIYKSLLGKSELNINEWYNTDDLVEIVSKDPLKFKFISRKNEMINVGGYKVDPNEVEENILNMPGIKDARVFGKYNSVMGNIICCEVVCENEQIQESEIRSFLQSKLQEFKIPRIFKFTNKIDTTRTGKTKRT